MKTLSLLLVLATAVGCTKKKFFEYAEEDVMLVESLPQDFPVPDEIWNQTLPAESAKPKQIVYTTARVIFKEKNKDVLKNPLMVLEFPRGGGEVDLSHITTETPGTFYLNFEFPEFANVTNTKIFFVSQSRQRKVEGEILGSGCKKVLDVTKAILTAQGKEGIKVNTTRHRHSSVLGGHFIILGESEKNWMITQVTFFDTSRPELFCPEFRSVQ